MGLCPNRVTDTETITDFDLLLIIAKSKNQKILAMTSYEGIPLSCIRNKSFLSQQDIDDWKTSQGEESEVIKKIRILLPVKMPLDLFLMTIASDSVGLNNYKLKKKIFLNFRR